MWKLIISITNECVNVVLTQLFMMFSVVSSPGIYAWLLQEGEKSWNLIEMHAMERWKSRDHCKAKKLNRKRKIRVVYLKCPAPSIRCCIVLWVVICLVLNLKKNNNSNNNNERNKRSTTNVMQLWQQHKKSWSSSSLLSLSVSQSRCCLTRNHSYRTILTHKLHSRDRASFFLISKARFTLQNEQLFSFFRAFACARLYFYISQLCNFSFFFNLFDLAQVFFFFHRKNRERYM